MQMIDAVWQMKPFAQMLLLAVCVAVAFFRGAGPERACAALFVWLAVSDRIYHLALGEVIGWEGINLGHLAIDAVAAAGFCAVGLWANRLYPLFIASFQYAALIAHFLRLIAGNMNATAYAIMIASPSYLQAIAFALGVVWHLRRSERYGAYRSWRLSAASL